MKKLKHAKRLLSLMLAITMVVTALPSTSITSLASPVSETLEAQPEPTTSGNGEDQTQDNDKKSDTTVSDESIPTAPEGEIKHQPVMNLTRMSLIRLMIRGKEVMM